MSSLERKYIYSKDGFKSRCVVAEWEGEGRTGNLGLIVLYLILYRRETMEKLFGVLPNFQFKYKLQSRGLVVLMGNLKITFYKNTGQVL